MTGTATGAGFGRLLVALYGILAFAAIGRSAYQVSTTFPATPAAYWLSALAAAVYVVAAVALARGRGRSRTVAWSAVGFEAAGVVGVGIASLLSDSLRHDGTVWRLFGADYGFIPLILPCVGLWWLWRTRPAGVDAPPSDRPPSDRPPRASDAP